MHEAQLPQDFHLFERGWRVPGHVEISSKLSFEMDAAAGESWGYLTFDFASTRTAIPNAHTFTAFLSLANGTPRQILRYAQRFGPIGLERRPGIDDEWRPQTAGPIASDGHVFDGRLFLSELFDVDSDIPARQIISWRGLARWTARLIDLAGRVRGQTAVPENEWQQVEDMIQTVRFDSSVDLSNIVKAIEDSKLEPEEKTRRYYKLWHELFDDWRRKNRYKRPADPWERLTHATAAVIGGNPVNLPMFFRFREGRLTFSFTSSLRAYLKLQTLYVIGMEADVVVCAGCHELFLSKRHPIAGRRAWCPKCGRRAAAKDAMRRMRERQRQHQQEGRAEI